MNPREQAEQTREFLEDAMFLESDDPLARIFIDRAIQRVTIDPKNEYYDTSMNRMLFENLDADALFEMIEEELLDAVNYLFMIEARGGPSLAESVLDIFDVWRQINASRNEDETA